MPIWPFLMLVGIFLAVLFLPPLLAAYVDYRREVARSRVTSSSTAEQPGKGASERG